MMGAYVVTPPCSEKYMTLALAEMCKCLRPEACTPHYIEARDEDEIRIGLMMGNRNGDESISRCCAFFVPLDKLHDISHSFLS